MLVLACHLAACEKIIVRTPLPTKPAKTVEGQVMSKGQKRLYRLFMPASDGEQPLPLLVNLHGLGGNAASQEALSRTSELAAQEQFMAVYPEGIWSTYYQGWQIRPDSDDVTFIRDLVDHLQAEYAIDETRIYATGLSNGRGMAERLAWFAARARSDRCERDDRGILAGPAALII